MTNRTEPEPGPDRPHVKVCRGCDEVLTDADDAVYAGHEEGASGPGWEIWAHRACLDLLRPDPVATRILARVLVAKALES